MENDQSSMENDQSSPYPERKKFIDNVVDMKNYLSHVDIDLNKIDTNLKQVLFNSNNYLKTVIAMYILWIIVGMIFFKVYKRWTWATAFYYTTETGLSIGFFHPLDNENISRVFTIFLVLVGSTMLVILSKAMFYFMLLDQRITRKKVKYPCVRDPVTNKIKYDKLLIYCWKSIFDFIGYYSSLSKFYIMCVFVITISLGILYGMVFEKWSFMTSMYWSVTSMSTGGLHSAVCLDGTDGDTCDIGDTRGVLMGLFFAIGVPVHVLGITVIADYFTKNSLNFHVAALIQRPIHKEDFFYAAKILKSNDKSKSSKESLDLTVGEYVTLELLRLGATTNEQIQLLKEQFELLDVNKENKLTFDTLQSAGRIANSSNSNTHVAVPIGDPQTNIADSTTNVEPTPNRVRDNPV